MRFARAGDGSAVVCVADFNRVQDVHRDREEYARLDPGSAAEDECYNALAQTVGKESQGCGWYAWLLRSCGLATGADWLSAICTNPSADDKACTGPVVVASCD